MPLVEGIGDEVTQFFLLVLLLLLGLAAWWSTQIADTPLVRTVLILERRTRQRSSPVRSPPVSSPVLTTENAAIATVENPQEPDDTGQNEEELTVSEVTAEGASSNKNESTSDESGQQQAVTTPQEPQDGLDCVLRRRRIAFLENLANNTQSSGVGATNADPLPEEDDDEEEEETEEDASAGPSSIRIRLKYLNDEQKLVEGQLHEPLGDFRRRHFSLELGANKLVRLIFNGQVLARDGASLEEHGLFDNCVVHCLVHQPRNTESNQQSTPSTQQPQAQPPQGASREWDLGSVVFMFLSVMIGLAWYGRCMYSQYFTTTASVALVGLTGVFVVSVVGLMLPDQDGLRQ